MPPVRETFLRVVSEVFFRDHARPMELLSLVILAGWAEFLLTSPDTFKQPLYAAFADFAPSRWAELILVVIAAQLVALWPSRWAPWIRFIAMSLAAGLWAVIALNWWSPVTPLAARSFTPIAVAALITAGYLGVVARQR